MTMARTVPYTPPMDRSEARKATPLLRAVTATRTRDMALTGLVAALGAGIAPLGSAAGGAVAGALAVAALRLTLPKGEWAWRAERLALPPVSGRTALPADAVLARLPVALLLLDAQARVTFCSEDARALLARDPVGEHIATVFRAPAVITATERALAGEDGTIEFTARRPRTRQLRATVRTLDGEADGTARAVLVLEDVSAVHRLDAMRMDFVANASHELRTPLAAIGGMVETLQGPARDDVANRDRFLAIVGREASRMARLVDDLLSLSRIELQANVAPTAREDLRPIVAEAIGTMTPLAAETGNVIRGDLGETPLTVRADRDELVQVFHNLVSNALRYGGPDRPVDIFRTQEPEGWIGVAVRDHGEGIEPSLVPRLTERFFRLDKRESVSRGGTGLGLAIVKHILTRHRGELRIESTVGEGSTFTVRLPGA